MPCLSCIDSLPLPLSSSSVCPRHPGPWLFLKLASTFYLRAFALALSFAQNALSLYIHEFRPSSHTWLKIPFLQGIFDYPRCHHMHIQTQYSISTSFITFERALMPLFM